MMPLKRYLTCVFLCALGVSGCVNRYYPDEWPEQARNTASVCPDLNGAYKNSGITDDGGSIFLASLFFPLSSFDPLMINYELGAISHFTIEYQDNSSWRISAWVEDELYNERFLSADDLPCREGRIVLNDRSWHLDGVPPFLPVVYFSSINRHLFLTSDGSLVVENHEVSTGTMLILPVGIKALYWYRFTPTTTITSNFQIGYKPRGVRVDSVPAQHLEPPQNAVPWSGYDDAQNCIKQAAKTNEIDQRAASLLAGQSMQSFLIQLGPDGELVPTGVVMGNNWLPGTHGLRIEKLNWQPPYIETNYILCLLDKGYSLGTVARGDSI